MFKQLLFEEKMIKFYLSFLLIIPYTLFGQKFAIIGDFKGGDTNAYQVSVLVKSFNPDFIVTTGDNYSQYLGTIDYQIGKFYHEYISPYVGSYGAGDTVNRFFPTLGNHDLEGTGLTDYQNYFSLPGNERYYDFIKGNVHFFILNSDTSEPDGNTDTSVQASWLQNALLNSNSFYNLVFLHHPPYSSGLHGSNIVTQWQYKTWGANAVFGGHDHDYERLFIDSLSYFICGASGSPLYSTFNNYPGTQKFYSDDFGAIIANTNNDSINFKFYNIKDSLIDSFSLNNTHLGFKAVDYYNKDNNLQLSVYPNPFINSINIKYFLTKSNEVSINVYDEFGKRIRFIPKGIQNIGYNEHILNTENFNEGVYSIVIQLNNYNFEIRAIKIKKK